MQLIEYPDREKLSIELASKIAGDLNAALLHQTRATLVVPGGTTPGPIFDLLCATSINWSAVDIMLSDERWVPETSERSNTRMLKERLFVSRAAKAGHLPLYAPYEHPEDELEQLSTQIQSRLPISVLLLGMGADMHTASLFPGADQLERALAPDAPPLLAMRAPGAPEPRMTLSAPVLDAAMAKHIVIFGAEKRAALEQAQNLSAYEAPVRAVLNGAHIHWAA
ncbi:MAG: 6-phosphogluconolactonase [Marinovum sp.]|nr:6-phosphogluconolactonase [Marinovum sp.]